MLTNKILLLVITGSTDKTIKIWDSMTFQLLSTINNDYAITRVVDLKNHSKIASGDSNGKIKIWDWKSGSLLATMTHYAPVVDLKLLYDGTIASVAAMEIRTWDLNTNLQKNCYTEASSGPVVVKPLSSKLIAGGLGNSYFMIFLLNERSMNKKNIC